MTKENGEPAAEPRGDAAQRDLGVSDRRGRIAELLAREGRVRVADLSRRFGLSEVTIRSDLTEMERLDLLERVHGGAVRTDKSYYRMTVPERMAARQREKQAIAGRAAAMVRPGDTVFINSGTTGVYLSRALRQAGGVLAVTNSPLAAQELAQSPACEVVLVGGSYNGPLAFTYGDDAVRQIAGYRANRFFMCCDGVGAQTGVMTYNAHEVGVNRQFLANSAVAVALADVSKIGRVSRVRVDGAECLDALITNPGADPAELAAIAEMGVEIVTA